LRRATCREDTANKFGKAPFIDQSDGLSHINPSGFALAFLRPILELLRNPQQEHVHFTKQVFAWQLLFVMIDPDWALAPNGAS
jgi:hypothetical protein